MKLNIDEYKAIKAIIEHTHDIELKDYLDKGQPEEHIFSKINYIRGCLILDRM